MSDHVERGFASGDTRTALSLRAGVGVGLLRDLAVMSSSRTPGTMITACGRLPVLEHREFQCFGAVDEQAPA